MTTTTPPAGIVGKIRKLLALAESDNENEAAVAGRIADKLMREHAVSMATLDEAALLEADPVGVEAFEVGQSTWKVTLAWTLAAHCGVSAIRGVRYGDAHPTKVDDEGHPVPLGGPGRPVPGRPGRPGEEPRPPQAGDLQGRGRRQLRRARGWSQDQHRHRHRRQAQPDDRVSCPRSQGRVPCQPTTAWLPAPPPATVADLLARDRAHPDFRTRILARLCHRCGRRMG